MDEGSYDYLLNMNIGGFIKNNVEKLETKIKEMKIEIEWYTNTTESKMWLKDIGEVEPLLIKS